MMAWGRFGSRRRHGLFGTGSGGPGGPNNWSGFSPGGRIPWSPWRRLALLLSVLLLVVTLSVFVADAMLRPPLQAWASSRAVNVATRAISTAVRDHVLPELDSGLLFEALTDTDGNVVLIDYDMVRLNHVRAIAAHYIQEQLADVAQEQLPVPLGLLTGVDFLSAYGPRMPIQIVPIGAVTVIPRSDFQATGINFVNHRLYIHVVVTMRLVAPYFDMTFPVEQEIVLTNHIIPGKVPNVFVGIEGLDLRQLQDGLLTIQGIGGR